jgi:four helix bundle protein
VEDAKQLLKASGSVGANYIEANEAISKKDFYYRIRICRKESKESRLFLRLADAGNDQSLQAERVVLITEATEFILIFNKILKSDPTGK